MEDPVVLLRFEDGVAVLFDTQKIHSRDSVYELGSVQQQCITNNLLKIVSNKNIYRVQKVIFLNKIDQYINLTVIIQYVDFRCLYERKVNLQIEIDEWCN